MCLRLFGVAFGLLLDLLLLCRVFGNDGHQIRWHRSVKLEAICKPLQVVQFDLLVIFGLGDPSIFNGLALLSSKSLEGIGDITLHSRSGIWRIASSGLWGWLADGRGRGCCNGGLQLFRIWGNDGLLYWVGSDGSLYYWLRRGSRRRRRLGLLNNWLLRSQLSRDDGGVNWGSLNRR